MACTRMYIRQLALRLENPARLQRLPHRRRPYSSRRRLERSGHSRITRRYCRERAPKQFRLRSLHRYKPRRRSQDKICPLPRRLYLCECRTACQRRTGDSASRQHRQRHGSASPLRDNHKRQHSKPAALYQIKFSPHRKARGFFIRRILPMVFRGQIFLLCAVFASAVKFNECPSMNKKRLPIRRAV